MQLHRKGAARSSRGQKELNAESAEIAEGGEGGPFLSASASVSTGFDFNHRDTETTENGTMRHHLRRLGCFLCALRASVVQKNG